MNYNLRITAVILILIITAGFLCETTGAINLPSEDAVLIRNFGFNDSGSPVMGMIFRGGTETLATESGEVIFSSSGNDKASRLPSPLGAWTAIDHGDGLISVYSRYEEGFSDVYVEKQQPVASPGISGWSSQEGFYFIIYDRRERRWINPAMLITPVQALRPPQILSVQLRNHQGDIVQANNLTHGRYSVYVNAVNQTLERTTLAPQRIVCSVNGAEAASLNFEAFSARDGVLMVYRNGLVPVKQVYASYPYFEAAEVFLTRGQANLEIIVQNIAGNSTSTVTRMSIN